MGYLVTPLALILIVGYILYLSSEKKKKAIKTDMDTLDSIANSLNEVVTDVALNRLLVIVEGIDNKHTKDELYIIKVDSIKNLIEERRKEIMKDYVDTVTTKK